VEMSDDPELKPEPETLTLWKCEVCDIAEMPNDPKPEPDTLWK
jgi:hypothetical protein